MISNAQFIIDFVQTLTLLILTLDLARRCK